MNINYKHRCIVREGPHERIYYGLTATEATYLLGLNWARDVPTPYAERWPAPRRKVGIADGQGKHFFNKRITFPSDFSPNAEAVQDASRGDSSPARSEEILSEWPAGNGAGDAKEVTEVTS